MPGIRTSAVLLRFLPTERGLDMGSFLIIVVKLYCYIDGNVRNLRKSEYSTRIFKTFTDVRKYDLTNDLRFFKPVTKVKYINN